MMSFTIEAIGYVRATRDRPEDVYWGDERSSIHLADALSSDALVGLEMFSRVEVPFIFHQVTQDRVVTDARHPRGNTQWPRMDIFAQRGKDRPNRIGIVMCRVLGVEGRKLMVSALDALDGTPVIDIKTVMREFLPRQAAGH